MELKQIITATVALIMICLVAIPLVDAASDITKNADNTQMVDRYIQYSGETLDLEKTETEVLMNGVVLTENRWLYSDDFVIYLRVSPVLMAIFDYENKIRVDDVSGSPTITSAHIENWTLSYGEYEAKFDALYYQSIDNNTGTYGRINASSTAFNLDKTSEIFMYYNGADAPKISFYGTYDDMKLGYSANVAGSVITTVDTITVQDNLKIVSAPLAGTEKTVTINSMNYYYNDSNVPASIVIAPYTYQTPTDSPVKTIIQLVPVLLIIALVLGVAANLYVRK